MALTASAPFGFEKPWVSRALRLLETQPELLCRDRVLDAASALGIGNRKVLALRFWLRAIGFAEPGSVMGLSPLGHLVRQYDPHLEEPGTWQIVHWQLASDRDLASAYWLLVHAIGGKWIDQSDLRRLLSSEFPEASERSISDAAYVALSIIRDTPLSESAGPFEKRATQGGTPGNRMPAVLLRDSQGDVSPTVFAFSVISWASKTERATVNILELQEPGGPGRAFGLSTAGVGAVLRSVQERYSKRLLRVSFTAGLDSVWVAEDVRALHAAEIYYLEQLEGMEPMAALRHAQTEGLSARLLSETGHVR